MTRSRSPIKKALRRAEDAIRERQFADAAEIYGRLLRSFEAEVPSLLDHAGALYGMILALRGLGDEKEANALADSAVEILSIHRNLTEIAA